MAGGDTREAPHVIYREEEAMAIWLFLSPESCLLCGDPSLIFEEYMSDGTL